VAKIPKALLPSRRDRGWCWLGFVLLMSVFLGPQSMAYQETRSSGSGWTNPVFGKDDPCTNARQKCNLLNTTKPEEFMNDLADKSQEKAASMQSVGMCMAGVARTVTGLCFNQETSICGNATGSGKCFVSMGFKKCDFTAGNREAMQKLQIKGAIYVYSGGPNGDGHVEVYTGDSSKPWCSDHCSAFAMQSTERVPEGIFVPPSFDAGKYAAAGLKCDSIENRQVAAK